jgi:hypothetical protein
MVGVEYSTAREAQAIISAHGGLLGYADHLAGRAGLVAGVGAAGEIGISRHGAAIGFSGRCLVVCIGPGMWAAKTSTGFATLKEVEKSWQARL